MIEVNTENKPTFVLKEPSALKTIEKINLEGMI